MITVKLALEVSIALMKYWTCRLKYWINWDNDEIISLEEELKLFEKLRDKKELEQVIKTIKDMIKLDVIFNKELWKTIE